RDRRVARRVPDAKLVFLVDPVHAVGEPLPVRRQRSGGEGLPLAVIGGSNGGAGLGDPERRKQRGHRDAPEKATRHVWALAEWEEPHRGRPWCRLTPGKLSPCRNWCQALG